MTESVPAVHAVDGGRRATSDVAFWTRPCGAASHPYTQVVLNCGRHPSSGEATELTPKPLFYLPPAFRS